MEPPPAHIDLRRDRGMTIQWADGTTSYYSIAYLRRMSPSAEARELREQMARNPLTVLPASSHPGATGPLTAVDAQLVGNYAIRITFSDGHNTGIYSWTYLRQIDPAAPQPPVGPQPVVPEDEPRAGQARGGTLPVDRRRPPDAEESPATT
jgi:DUF971 family protein